ncbi:MAG TPA: SET domain-containing protein-lysine N-methyltransferase [Segetibacter sp.]
MALLEKHLEVKESNIPGAGSGLFTREFIAKGTRIVEYKGKIRTWKEVQYDDGNLYIFYVTRNHVIDGGNYKRSIARYINDAKGLTKIKGLTNNAEFVRDGLRIFVDATKDIPAGAEIFVGYGKKYWEVIRKNLKLDTKQSKVAAQ